MLQRKNQQKLIVGEKVTSKILTDYLLFII